MAYEQDAGDLIAAGIMKGFADINPMAQYREHLNMLRSQQDFSQMMDQERLAIQKAADARAEVQSASDLKSAELNRILAQRADIRAGKATDIQNKLNEELLKRQQTENAEKAELKRVRTNLFTQMISGIDEQITDKKLATTLKNRLIALQNNPAITAADAVKMLEDESRKMAMPFIRDAILRGDTAFKPEAAQYVDMKYGMNEPIPDNFSEVMMGFLKDDKQYLRGSIGTLMQEMAKVAALSGGAGVSDAMDGLLQLSAYLEGVNANMGKGYTPLFGQLDKAGEASAAAQMQRATPTEAQAMGAAELVVRATNDDITRQELTGDAKQKAAAKSARMIDRMYSDTPQAIEAGAQMTGENAWAQEAVTHYESGKKLGAFSAMVAAFAPTGEEGDITDRYANSLDTQRVQPPPERLENGRESPEYKKFTQSFSDATKLIDDIERGQAGQKTVFKGIPLEEVYLELQNQMRKLLLTGQIGEIGAEATAVNNMYKWARTWTSQTLTRTTGRQPIGAKVLP